MTNVTYAYNLQIPTITEMRAVHKVQATAQVPGPTENKVFQKPAIIRKLGTLKKGAECAVCAGVITTRSVLFEPGLTTQVIYYLTTEYMDVFYNYYIIYDYL